MYKHYYNKSSFVNVSFETILGLAAGREPMSHWAIVGKPNPRKGKKVIRKSPHRRKFVGGYRQDSNFRLREKPDDDTVPMTARSRCQRVLSAGAAGPVAGTSCHPVGQGKT